MKKEIKNGEFTTETEEALQELATALEKFRDAVYKEFEPMVKKLADFLESLEKEER